MPDNVPTFFFSHSRQDRETTGSETTESHLERFFRNLKEKVANYSGVDHKTIRIGTIDLKVRQGADWDRDLSDPLSTDKVFVAILSPTYFNRENCGKELFAFVQRSPNIGIDINGALTDIENVLPIRWYYEEVYSVNTQKDALIPPILRRINYVPADDGNDPERTAAIERYRKKGMQRCVAVEPHYEELLHLFALRIRELDDLPSAGSISFATLCNAFACDWRTYLASKGKRVDEVPLPASLPEQIGLRTLESVVAFYVTNRSFEPDPTAVDFADQLIAESPVGEPAGTDSMLATLLADVRVAGVEEGLTVFHAAANPVVPDSPEPLLDRLASLSASGVLAALVVDPTVWPATAANPQAADAVERIIRSNEWTGPVLLPSLDTAAIDLDGLATRLGLTRRIVELPQESEARVDVLRRAFVDERGYIWRMSSTGLAPDAEPPPGLKGVSPEGE